MTTDIRKPEIQPFADEHLTAAGRLLAERHRVQRLVEPALDPAYEEPAAAHAEIASLLEAETASGMVALRDGEVIGFLLGSERDASWGPNIWVEPAGHAVVEPELARDLYAEAAARWVDAGRTSHYAIVPATDRELVDAWFRLGFGHQHVHAIREPAGPSEGIDVPDGLLLRAPTRDDLNALAEIDMSLPRHQALAPVFSPLAVPSVEQTRVELEEDFDDPRFTTFVVERDHRPIGYAIACAIEVSSMHASLARPPGAGFLGFAAVLPEHRGSGAGRALGQAILCWARDGGHPSVVSDWRMTNLLASRTWPGLGFRPTFYRLHRAVV